MPHFTSLIVIEMISRSSLLSPDVHLDAGDFELAVFDFSLTEETSPTPIPPFPGESTLVADDIKVTVPLGNDLEEQLYFRDGVLPLNGEIRTVVRCHHFRNRGVFLGTRRKGRCQKRHGENEQS